jgi:hypothetical protein
MILVVVLCCELTLEKPEWGRKIREAVQSVWEDGCFKGDLHEIMINVLVLKN